jgi:hypothetical protein
LIGLAFVGYFAVLGDPPPGEREWRGEKREALPSPQELGCERTLPTPPERKQAVWGDGTTVAELGDEAPVIFREPDPVPSLESLNPSLVERPPEPEARIDQLRLDPSECVVHLRGSWWDISSLAMGTEIVSDQVRIYRFALLFSRS